MIPNDNAYEFAREWIDAWNAHDLERILSHYAEDVEMTTPMIMLFFKEPGGRIKGKADLRSYWKKALSRVSDLHFWLRHVYVGVDSIVVCYDSTLQKEGAEVMFFNKKGLISKSCAHYFPLDSDLKGVE